MEEELSNSAKQMNHDNNPAADDEHRFAKNIFLPTLKRSSILKEMIHASAVRLSRYGCT